MKEWDRECTNRYFNSEMNRIIVKLCMLHYVECWRDRNEKYHNPQKQREYVIEWTKALEEKVLRSNKIDAIG